MTGGELALFLGGSLGAVLVLAMMARLLGLGGGGIWSEAEAISEAESIVAGFEGDGAVLGADGQAALVRGRDGSVVLLKQHGSRVAGRRLADRNAIAVTDDGLRVTTGERRFGDVTIRGVSTF